MEIVSLRQRNYCSVYSMSKVISPYGDEPKGITQEGNYNTKLAVAFNWYNQEKEKKDARLYLRQYVTAKQKHSVKIFDEVSDQKIINTFGWIARLINTGSTLSTEHMDRLDQYLTGLLSSTHKQVAVTVQGVRKPSVRDNMEEKVREYLGELEGALDAGEEFNLHASLQSKNIPGPYMPFIQQFISKKAGEFITVYESDNPMVKEGYSNFGKRKLTFLIKMLGQWNDDVNRYTQHKKANRKPRTKKTKPPVEQVSKLKYLKEDKSLNITSVNPVEIVGASQAWIYNVKYKRLSVYRTDSSQGLQVKNSSLQNYDPEQCEQRSLRKPAETLSKVLGASKVQLRKLISELSTKEVPVKGRINEECLIVRVLK